MVLASTTGDVLLSRAMKSVGDVGNSGSAGLLTVAAVLAQPQLSLGYFHDGGGVL